MVFRRKIYRSVSLLFGALLILLSSCRVSEESREIVHPVPSLIPGIDDSHDLDSHDYGSKDLQDARELAQNLLSSTKILTLGALNGKPYEMFGQISDIKLDSSGNMYILDAQYSEVRVFNSEGLFLYSVGSPGRGPGEFFMPRGMEVDSIGRVYVVDKSYRKTIFKRVGNTHKLEKAVTLSVSPVGLCKQDGILYVHGTSSGKSSNAIFSYALEGDSLGAFGTIYKSPSAMVQHVFGRGNIACSRHPGRIIYSPRLLPTIYGYSLEGDIRWVAKISNFETLRVVENKLGDSGQSEVSMGLLSSKHDQVVGIVPLPEKYVIVQIASFTPESVDPEEGEGERYAMLRSYIMLSRSGEAVYIGDSLPIIKAVSEDHFYTIYTSPYPQISVRSYSTVDE